MSTDTSIDTSLGLTGKVAVVTGAARGIGRETVELLCAHGALVVAEDINPAVGELARDDRVATLVGDVSEEETARRAVALAIERFGALDILVNNAGRTMNKPALGTSCSLIRTLLSWVVTIPQRLHERLWAEPFPNRLIGGGGGAASKRRSLLPTDENFNGA